MRTLLRLAAPALVVVVAVAAGAGDAPAPPRRLADTGLYADPATRRIAADVWPYSPQYPLWSDGAAKHRWVHLPPGSTIDVSNPDRWEFPVGAKFWKEFVFAGRRVETRFLWRATAERWVFATYVWSAEQTDATLAPDDGVPGAAEIAPGVEHDVPGRSDCLACHESGRIEVLGFGALQLSDDRDPMAPHTDPLGPGDVTLRVLEGRGLFSPSRPEWVAHPPKIEARTPRERAALGYLSANCGGCHNPENPAASTGLLLRHPVAAHAASDEPALATTVGIEGGWRVPGMSPGSSRRLAPGDPDRSAILYRMASRRPMSQMPPLGSKLPDDEALSLIRAWIKDE